MGRNQRSRPRTPPALPPPMPGWKRLPVLSPPPLGSVTAVLLSYHVWGTALHYDPTAGRYFPCPLGQADCSGCQVHHQTARWVGYAHGMVTANGRIYAVAFSADAWAGCPELHNDQGKLRGACVKLVRPGKGKVGKVVASIVARYGDDQLPAPVDIRPGMCLGWGLQADWWEWYYGLDPAGIVCPALCVKAPDVPDKQE